MHFLFLVAFPNLVLSEAENGSLSDEQRFYSSHNFGSRCGQNFKDEYEIDRYTNEKNGLTLRYCGGWGKPKLKTNKKICETVCRDGENEWIPHVRRIKVVKFSNELLERENKSQS